LAHPCTYIHTTLPTIGCRSVGIVRLRTTATEFFCLKKSVQFVSHYSSYHRKRRQYIHVNINSASTYRNKHARRNKIILRLLELHASKSELVFVVMCEEFCTKWKVRYVYLVTLNSNIFHFCNFNSPFRIEKAGMYEFSRALSTLKNTKLLALHTSFPALTQKTLQVCYN
jgi:hypothetical protein